MNPYNIEITKIAITNTIARTNIFYDDSINAAREKYRTYKKFWLWGEIITRSDDEIDKIINDDSGNAAGCNKWLNILRNDSIAPLEKLRRIAEASTSKTINLTNSEFDLISTEYLKAKELLERN
jgi:hypothetical protein